MLKFVLRRVGANVPVPRADGPLPMPIRMVGWVRRFAVLGLCIMLLPAGRMFWMGLGVRRGGLMRMDFDSGFLDSIVVLADN